MSHGRKLSKLIQPEESFYLFGPAEGYSGAPLTGLIVPDGHVEIGMVVSGAFFDRHEGAWTPFPECYVDPILTEATTIRCEPGSLLLAAKLRFGAAQRLIAGVGDAHTYVAWPYAGPFAFRRYPIRMALLSDLLNRAAALLPRDWTLYPSLRHRLQDLIDTELKRLDMDR